MPFTAAQFLCALMLPAALAALLTCCARDLRARPSSAHMGLGGVMLLLTIAVAHAASAMAVGASLMPPLMGWNWLPWMALAAVPLFVFAMPSRLTESPLPASIFQHAWRWCAVAATTACGAWVLLRPFEITNEFTYLHLAGGIAAAAMLAIATGIVSSSADRHPFTDRITSIICSGGITLGILVTGSVNMALLAGIVPLAILGGGLAAWVTDRGSWSGGLLATGIVISWQLLIGSEYSYLPLWNAPVFALVLPASLAAARLGSTPQRRALWQIGTALVGIAIALALAATLGQPQTPASDGPSYNY